MDISGSLKAALIMCPSTSGPAFVRASAMCGLVDQTRLDAVGERGKNAMGPVGKNLWYAVVFGG